MARPLTLSTGDIESETRWVRKKGKPVSNGSNLCHENGLIYEGVMANLPAWLPEISLEKCVMQVQNHDKCTATRFVAMRLITSIYGNFHWHRPKSI